MKIGVFGAGAWGTALAYTCAKAGNNVVLWGFNEIFHEFDDVEKPENVTLTGNIKDLQDCKFWLIVTPAAFFRETAQKMRDIYNEQPILICTKGMESPSGKFMSEILNEEIPECKNIGVLSGPQFAHEVASGVPTGSTLAGNDVIRQFGHIALSELYLQDVDDILGTQFCGVGKNAAALISGFMTVKGQGENERALVFVRVWNEIMQIAIEMGADVKTFLGLCGIGDLFLSATSPTSRNFSAGLAIARNEKIEGTIEGIFALCGLIERAQKLNVKTPILCEMKDRMCLSDMYCSACKK
jgi:glycerol-3-phosphate dehydrogenase (NAD(P)+)